MQAIGAFVGSQIPGFIDLPAPASPLGGQVLCRTIQLGVCGTDREILLSRKPWVPIGESCIALGHECLAEVVAFGPDAKSVTKGQLVVPVVRRPIGKPKFRVDMLAFGQFTERGIVMEHGFSQPYWLDHPDYLIPVPPAIRNSAVFTEPLAVAEKGINEAIAIQHARLETDLWHREPPRVLITGLGPIAFAAVIGCSYRRWPMTVLGRDSADSQRASLVAEFGGLYRHTRDFTTAADVEQNGFDLILECTGSDELTLQAAESLASRGVMVWVGSTRIPEARVLNVELLMRNGILRNHVHIGTVNAARRDFEHAIRDLLAFQESHPARLEKLFTARVSPRDSLWHYQHREPQGIKTVLEYRSTS